ncbi:MAG: TPM domain-containing protein, partial [Phascolarctobacterium sp.]|nr:TPM domain-containing protein [Phascolarctobacterium sp.]
MKKLLLTFLLLIQMLCMSTALASPAIPPKPAGADMYVQDYAEVIAPIDKGRILDIGLELQDKTSAQVVVLTVKNLEQEPIEAYAEDVMQSWELGSRESHAGVLMVVATDNKQAYIEVGSGLEGV